MNKTKVNIEVTEDSVKVFKDKNLIKHIILNSVAKKEPLSLVKPKDKVNWRANEGELYDFIKFVAGKPSIVTTIDTRAPMDNDNYTFHNYFNPNSNNATIVCNKILDIFNSL